jgi:amidase
VKNLEFCLLEASLLHQEILAGHVDASCLVDACLERIGALDRRGPELRSVIEINPDAIDRAQELDHAAAGGDRPGALHGLPVLIKDNIATGDRMSTSAGSLALAGLQARRDASLVESLRLSGAVILGKTNLSEWANIRSPRSSSGWSSRGGQTRNPHVLSRSPVGSSSGSAAAVAAGLCSLAVGTETDGSIVQPASACGIVGLKPTVGRISRDGIIPIARSQDTAGPMARTVRDVAMLLQVLSSRDPRDPETQRATEPEDYIAALRRGALEGARIGVVRGSSARHPGVEMLFEEALAHLRRLGALLVDVDAIPSSGKFVHSEFFVLLHELKDGLPRYLQEFQPDAPFRDLEGLIAWNESHRAEVMPFFGQEFFHAAQATRGVASMDYLEALSANRRFSREEGIDALFAQHQLDAVVAPTGGLAWRTDHLLGDFFSDGGITSSFAVAGYPHLTVPMGTVRDVPVGLSWGGLEWMESKILAMAYDYEQASQRRVTPRFLTD